MVDKDDRERDDGVSDDVPDDGYNPEWDDPEIRKEIEEERMLEERDEDPARKRIPCKEGEEGLFEMGLLGEP